MKKYWKLFVYSLTAKIDSTKRLEYGLISALVSSLCNLFLLSGKLIVGYMSGSVAMVADGLNNLSDLSSQVVTLLSFKISNKPADKDHPYGHARAEYLATTLVSVLIIMMGISLLRSAYNSLGENTLPEISLYSIVVLLFSILIKMWMYFYNRKLGLSLKSELLIATAKDSRNDVLATSAVLMSALVALFFKINIDPYVGAIVAIFVLKTGLQIMLDMINRLMGSSPEPELFKNIIQKVNSYPEILSSHDLLIHEYGPGNIYATIHVAMDADSRLSKIHSIVDHIERSVSEEDGVKLLIHVDPERAMTVEEQRIVRLIQNTIHTIDMQLSMHDFQFLGENKEGMTSISFDIVIPDSCKLSNEALEMEIKKKIKEQALPVQMFIDFDRAYQRYKKTK